MDELTLDREYGLLIARLQGVVNVDRCRKLFRSMRGLEGSQRLDRFVDLAGVDEAHLKYDDIWWLARHCSSHWTSDRRARCIVHAERDVLFGIARMFQSLVDTDQLDIVVCRSRSEAAVILGVPVNVLERAVAT